TTMLTGPPLGGVNATVTTSSAMLAEKPLDIPSHTSGRTRSSIRSPGPAKGRSVLPRAERKVVVALGITSQEAWTILTSRPRIRNVTTRITSAAYAAMPLENWPLLHQTLAQV